MQTRYMERSNTMTRGKRALEGEDEKQPERKRPALASVIVEALKLDSLQKLCSSLEPILRRVVSEEVERALAKIGPTRLTARSSPKHIEGPDGRNLQLHFRSRLSLPLFTGGKVEGEQGASIHVVLVDAESGHVVTSGPEASVKLDVVVLEGDFNNEDDEGWTEEEFDGLVVKEREGKRPLLTGDLQVTLKEGVGTVGELTFTDNSSWIRSRKFRLGLKVTSGYCEGIRIREAKTEAFAVKDHRGELYKKHYPPALNDDVWRLEKIGKDGSFHKRLNEAGIFFVEDFLRLVVRDPAKLRRILGSGMSNKMWDALLEHAKTCALSGKLYVYYPEEDLRNVGVVFNNIYELSGLIAGEQFHPADALSDSQKLYVDTLVKKAYENWNQVVEYDGKSLLHLEQSKRLVTSQNDLPMGHIDYSNGLNHPLHKPGLPTSFPTVEHSIIGAPGQPINQSIGNVNNFGVVQNLNPFDDWEREMFSEEEIRLRSHEMLENEDMQQLLRMFSNVPEDGAYMPNFDGEDRARPGRAVVGWLKIKAAMRWGFFIRKKAAEKRAQLVELKMDE